MATPKNNKFDPSRRDFFRLSAGATLGLSMVGAIGSLTACSGQVQRGKGFKILRSGDVVLFTALVPVILKGVVKSPEDISRAVKTIDAFLYDTHPMIHKQTLELCDLLNLSLTRGALTGLWKTWEAASIEEIDSALYALKNHSIGLLQMAYGALVQIPNLSWYMQPDTYASTGYPGPPKKIPYHSTAQSTASFSTHNEQASNKGEKA